jgi:hypothetical protein
MEFEMSGAECSISELVFPVTGSLCEKTAGLEEEKVKELATSSQTIQEESKCGALKIGKTEVKIGGEVKQEVELGGANAGKIWAPARATLCKVIPVNTFCPAGESFKKVTVNGSLEEGKVIELVKKEAGTVTCTKSAFEGPFRTSGMGTITALTYTGAGEAGKCLNTIPGQAAQVAVTFPTLPTFTSLFLYNLAEGNGTLALASTPVQLKMKIAFKPVCTYQLATSYGIVTNGTAEKPITKFVDGGVWAPVAVEGGKIEECPANLEQKESKYQLKAGAANVYIARWW